MVVGPDEIKTGRRRAMRAFALAPLAILSGRYDALGEETPDATAVRGPEVGLVMLRGRAGGGGAPFNLGEASATRATVRLGSGEVGHALVLGRDFRKAAIAAHLDALWQREDWRERIEHDVVAPALVAHAEAARRVAEETEATRVDFFTLARGDD